MQYNPQIEIQLNRLDVDGKEVFDQNDPICNLSSKNPAGDVLNDYNYHSTNKPIRVNCDISKNIGSENDSAAIALHNHPLFEQLRENPASILNAIENSFYRLRVWAWHDDNDSLVQQPRPNIPPAFVGDVYEGFGFQSNEVTDSVITIQALSHGWLANSDKMRQTWPEGTEYLKIVEDIFAFIVNDRGYGIESIGAAPKSVIEGLETAGRLSAKKLVKPFTIDRNPTETLNDICRELDMDWGIDNNIPYILNRNYYFATNELNSQPVNPFNTIYDETSKTGLTSYGLYNFSSSMIYDAGVVLGNLYRLLDSPQINTNAGIEGKLKSQSIKLSNVDGHNSQMEFDVYDIVSDKVKLPRRRRDEKSRSTTLVSGISEKTDKAGMDLRVSLVCEVLEVDPCGLTMIVKPAIQERVMAETNRDIDYPEMQPIEGVPIPTIGGVLSIPNVGDHGLCIFHDTDLQAYQQERALAPLESARFHDYSDAMFFPYESASKDRPDPLITINQGEVVFKGKVIFDDEVCLDGQILNNHTHTNGYQGSPTGPQVPQPCPPPIEICP